MMSICVSVGRVFRQGDPNVWRQANCQVVKCDLCVCACTHLFIFLIGLPDDADQQVLSLGRLHSFLYLVGQSVLVLEAVLRGIWIRCVTTVGNPKSVDQDYFHFLSLIDGCSGGGLRRTWGLWSWEDSGIQI